MNINIHIEQSSTFRMIKRKRIAYEKNIILLLLKFTKKININNLNFEFLNYVQLVYFLFFKEKFDS